ncbi:MAG: arsenate reductase ArsC [Tepidisphaeraceae bacterium]
MRDKLKILFLCTGNSCRSQMAEAFARHVKGDVIEPYSAGVAPQALNPLAVKVTSEIGIDISAQRSRHVDGLKHLDFDYVVTVCDSARDTCPVFPEKTGSLHVAFDDPPRLARSAKSESEAIQHYRRVRDEIASFVKTLPESLDTFKE